MRAPAESVFFVLPYVCDGIKAHIKPNMNENNWRVWISADLRRGINSLLTSFGEDIWEDKFEIVLVKKEFGDRLKALVGSTYKIKDRLGTKDDFVRLREACVPTE